MRGNQTKVNRRDKMYGLGDFCTDIKTALTTQDGDAARETIRTQLEELLKNQGFISANCHEDAEVGAHVLYQDDELGFMVLNHVNDEGRKSPPHDHGESWAIYGQAVGHTDMSEFDRLDDEAEDGKAEVQKVNEYRLTPGLAGMFGPRQIHAINFIDGSRFIRVTGTDLAQIATRKFDMAEGTVTEVPPTAGSLGAGGDSA